MKYENAQYILREFAIPNYRDFLTNQLSARYAFNAAVSIAHMVDHIVDGRKGAVQNKRNEFEQSSKPFSGVVTMCNAVKHVRVYSRESAEVATVWSVAVADRDTVLFTSPIDGLFKEFKPETNLLTFDCYANGTPQKIWVGITLFSALLFVARKLNLEELIHAEGLPDECNLLYRNISEAPKAE